MALAVALVYIDAVVGMETAGKNVGGNPSRAVPTKGTNKREAGSSEEKDALKRKKPRTTQVTLPDSSPKAGTSNVPQSPIDDFSEEIQRELEDRALVFAFWLRCHLRFVEEDFHYISGMWVEFAWNALDKVFAKKLSAEYWKNVGIITALTLLKEDADVDAKNKPRDQLYLLGARVFKYIVLLSENMQSYVEGHWRNYFLPDFKSADGLFEETHKNEIASLENLMLGNRNGVVPLQMLGMAKEDSEPLKEIKELLEQENYPGCYEKVAELCLAHIIACPRMETIPNRKRQLDALKKMLKKEEEKNPSYKQAFEYFEDYLADKMDRKKRPPPKKKGTKADSAPN